MHFNLISTIFLFTFLFCEVTERLAKSFRIQAWTEILAKSLRIQRLDAKIWPNLRRPGQTDPAPTAKLPKIWPTARDLQIARFFAWRAVSQLVT